MNLQAILIEQWYQQKRWGWCLWPLTQLFQTAVKVRRWCYAKGICKSYKAAVPVIVVGNITVGGTGKTPLVIHLCELLLQQGFKPGILLHGYKSSAIGALSVQHNSAPKLVGDEAVLLARRCACPVVVAKKRIAGVKRLIADHKVDIILCDDGLQHYALQRDLEIAVIDGERKFGNGRCLPMGPLRELPERLANVDLTIVNGEDMQLISQAAYSLLNKKNSRSLISFAGKTVHAIAGIGTPEKFFQQLRQQGVEVIPHSFPDHHTFKKSDVSFADRLPIFMTEKDAVKCGTFATEQHWVVPITIVLLEHVQQKFCQLVQELKNGR